MKKQSFMIFPLLLVGLLFFAISCKKDDKGYDLDETGIPVLSHTMVSEVTRTTAYITGVLLEDGDAPVFERGFCWNTKGNPTIDDDRKIVYCTQDYFSGVITMLSSDTPYHIRAYATNKKGTGYTRTMGFLTKHVNYAGSFTDQRDNIVYNTVKIGDQVWMAENLRYLPEVSPPGIGSNTSPHYYVYSYDGTDIAVAQYNNSYYGYGVLYNWPAAMAGGTTCMNNPSKVQGVCPDGWHLPSDAEWKQLIDYLGGESLAGGKMKEVYTWKIPVVGNNESGFRARPGGLCYANGVFINKGTKGLWWSATEVDDMGAWSRTLSHNSSAIAREYPYKSTGISVRCVKDSP